MSLMREDGVRYGDAEVIYTAVRQFGGAAWRKWRRRAAVESFGVKVA